MVWGNTENVTRDLPCCRGLACKTGEVGGPFRGLGEHAIREVGDLDAQHYEGVGMMTYVTQIIGWRPHIRKLGRHWYDQTVMTRANLVDM